jgi:hypothetical protein
MPKITIEPVTVTPEDFIEACTPRDIDRVIEILKEDFEDDLVQNVHPSVEKFLDDCNHFEKEEAYESLKDDYGFDEDSDVRSESQRLFNYHLSCLKNGWLGVSKEDADIIAILAKKYGAV